MWLVLRASLSSHIVRIAFLVHHRFSPPPHSQFSRHNVRRAPNRQQQQQQQRAHTALYPCCYSPVLGVIVPYKLIVFCCFADSHRRTFPSTAHLLDTTWLLLLALSLLLLHVTCTRYNPIHCVRHFSPMIFGEVLYEFSVLLFYTFERKSFIGRISF